jgi:hypothetical protein
MADILAKLKTRFDPRIVQPDELARSAHDEIERLRAALKQAADWLEGEGLYSQADETRHAYQQYGGEK